MLSILVIILPVFMVVLAGYVAARWGGFGEAAANGVMRFAILFAVPCLLILAIYRLDLREAFDLSLMGTFYAGALSCFALGVIGARHLFGRRPGESIAIGFGALFSNSLLLGLPIMERAYGADSMAPSYAIISIHSPFCYLVGIVCMEIARRDGAGAGETIRRAARQMFSNAISIGIGIGFAVNLSGVTLPGFVEGSLEMIARAALPAALFGIGAALTRYRVRLDLGVAAWAVGLSLIMHPLIVWVLGQAVGLTLEQLRGAVVTAAMPTGINAFLFASMYRRAESAAAAIVLLGTATSVLTAAAWLWVLGGAAV